MYRLLERGYYGSPVWAQNLAITAAGYRLHRQRFGNDRGFLDALGDSEHYSATQMQEYVDARLRAVVSHAFLHVPFYRRLALDGKVTASDVRGMADLWKLPIVEKDQIRLAPQDFTSDQRVSRRPFKLSTSGTTGTPLTIYCDAQSRQRHYAFWTRLRRWFGVTPGMHRATFFGRIICSPEQRKPPFWRYDYFQRNHLFSSYHLAAQNIRSYCDALRRLQPDEIVGYPSSISALANFICDEGITDIRPRVVFTTAETLLDFQRQSIEKAFGTTVVDQYGCTEMALFVSQCEKGTHHVHPEHGVLEVVGPDGTPVLPGTPGQAVCTGLVNLTMPLLRYRLGDRLAVRDGGCRCGRAFPVVSDILGRVDDVLLTPSGRPLGRLDPVFKPLKGIRATQIIQRRLDHLVVRLSVDSRFSNSEQDSLLYELTKRTGNEMRIEFEYMDGIPKDLNGKFRAVVSLLSPSEKHDRAVRLLKRDAAG